MSKAFSCRIDGIKEILFVRNAVYWMLLNRTYAATKNVAFYILLNKVRMKVNESDLSWTTLNLERVFESFSKQLGR